MYISDEDILVFKHLLEGNELCSAEKLSYIIGTDLMGRIDLFLAEQGLSTLRESQVDTDYIPSVFELI